MIFDKKLMHTALTQIQTVFQHNRNPKKSKINKRKTNNNTFIILIHMLYFKIFNRKRLYFSLRRNIKNEPVIFLIIRKRTIGIILYDAKKNLTVIHNAILQCENIISKRYKNNYSIIYIISKLIKIFAKSVDKHKLF